MITLLITQEEAKIKNLLSQILQKAGYNISPGLDENNLIKVIKQDGFKNTSLLEDTIVNLGDSLYKEKRGELYKHILDKIEKPLFEHILERTEGNQLKAAKILGINRNTIRTKIKRLGIDVSKWKR